ncbi:hypothetical protein ROLI_047880 (plasmid) [Roseobacter fucihabitans]|uniref:Uncharacterized protein n=2 Tax=Roseobacter fucihabitans TaxID=1537242 RepID=A0ABZ2C293_9RHOB|nr:hypothetical protein [Roseobacter litoralis]
MTTSFDEIVNFISEPYIMIIALCCLAFDRIKLAGVTLLDNTLEQDFGLAAVVFSVLTAAMSAFYWSADLLVVAGLAAWFAVTKFFSLSVSIIQTLWVTTGYGPSPDTFDFLSQILTEALPEFLGSLLDLLLFAFGWILVILKGHGLVLGR